MDFDLNTYRPRILNILRTQRDALCVTIKFIDHITHRRTASRSNSIKAFPNEYYQIVYQRLLASLAQQFL